MEKHKKIFVGIVTILILISCTNQNVTINESKPPDAKELLNLDSNADFFQWENRIYQTGIEWVDQLDIQMGEQIGEIKAKSTNPQKFSNGVATKLPIGSKIFSVKDRDDILIVKNDNNEKRYFLLTEG